MGLRESERFCEMKKKKTTIPKQYLVAIVLSLICIFWMLFSMWQFAGMRFYAFAILTLLALGSSAVVYVSFLSSSKKRKRIAIGYLVCSFVLAFGGMVISNMEKGPEQGLVQKLENSHIVSAENLEKENQDGSIPIYTLTNTGNGVEVAWSAVPGATGYCIFRSDEDGYKHLTTILDAGVTNYLDVTALSNTEYSYGVCSYNGSRLSKCLIQRFMTGIWRPEISVAQDQAYTHIYWSAVTNSEYYKLYRKQGAGKYKELVTINNGAPLEFLDETSEFGVNYTYAVRAFAGEKSSPVRSKAFKLEMESMSFEVYEVNEQVLLQWKPMDFATGYSIYRKTGDDKFSVIGAADADTLKYVDETALPNTEYVYAVRACRNKYKSDYDEASITTGAFEEKNKVSVEDLERVTVSLSKEGNGVSLAWNNVTKADGYHVYRKAVGEAEYTLIDTIEDVLKNSAVDETAKSGTTYLYYVCAYVGDQEGCYTGAQIAVK